MKENAHFSVDVFTTFRSTCVSDKNTDVSRPKRKHSLASKEEPAPKKSRSLHRGVPALSGNRHQLSPRNPIAIELKFLADGQQQQNGTPSRARTTSLRHG